MKDHKKCFVNSHCSFDCPNFFIDSCDEKYGFGIADDIGVGPVKCSKCYLNSYECVDCLLEYTSFCPEYSERSLLNE